MFSRDIASILPNEGQTDGGWWSTVCGARYCGGNRVAGRRRGLLVEVEMGANGSIYVYLKICPIRSQADRVCVSPIEMVERCIFRSVSRPRPAKNY